MSAQARFQQLVQYIESADPGALRALAGRFRAIGRDARSGGTALMGSANAVGARRGAPYAAYRDRLAPTATWMTGVQPPAETAATAVENAAAAVESARMELANVRAWMNTFSVPGGTSPEAADAAIEAAYQRAVAQLEPRVDAMIGAYSAVQPQQTGTPPAARGSVRDAGTAGMPPGGTGVAPASSTGPGDAGGATAGATAAGAEGVGAGGVGAGGVAAEAGAVGPESGPYAGWVRDPQTDNLVDPATGREVNGEGRFIDPITGEPFGDPAQYATRLEGLAGGTAITGGLVSPPGGVAASLGGAGAIGGAGGVGFAGLYGGMIPPSLVGTSPISGRLQQQAAQNLHLKAAAASTYAAMAGGTHTPGAYLPPMAGGAGAPGAGGRGGAPRGRGIVTESGSVWGATGRGAEKEGRRRGAGARTGVAEDADVWTDGEPPRGAAVLGGG